MRHKKKVLAGALIVLMAGTAGCGLFTKTSSPVDPPPKDTNQTADKNVQTMATTLYFSDEKGFVVPMKVNIPKVEGPANQILSYLTPEKANGLLTGTGLHSSLPEGTKMTVTIKDNTAIVDFNNAIMKMKVARQEQQLVDSVVWSLTELPNVKQVQFKMNGTLIPALPVSNTPIGQPLSRANGINLQVAPNINPADTTRVTVYYQGTNNAGNFSYLVPITRMIAKTNEDMVKTAMVQLVSGPMTAGLKSTVSENTKLLSEKISGDTVTLDFENLLTDGAAPEQKKLLDSIVLSVLDNTNAQKVKITVKGQVPTTTPGLDLSKPMMRPQMINQKQL